MQDYNEVLSMLQENAELKQKYGGQGEPELSAIKVIKELMNNRTKIVRCKDCKYYAEHPRFKMKLCFQHLNPIAMPENGFCNYGEER